MEGKPTLCSRIIKACTKRIRDAAEAFCEEGVGDVEQLHEFLQTPVVFSLPRQV